MSARSASGAARARDEAPRGQAPPRHVYIHVPFCRAKCDYCDFYSEPLGEGGADAAARKAAFVAAVHAEWAAERRRWGVRRLQTLYVGGGTPSLLGADGLDALLAPFAKHMTPKAEVTVEANPEDVTAAFAGWAAARRLRVSLGVQSFDAALRAALGRRAAADPSEAVLRLRQAGLDDLSLDFMFGIPSQTPAMLDADLAAVARLRPAHVSWYELDVVPGTPLAKRREPRPDDEARAGLYRRLVTGLARLGYRWYEVSNFALPGHRCRHNLAYWRGRDYLGLGPGAVSTVGARRWLDRPDVSAYCAALAAGREPPRRLEHLDETAQRRERLLLAARIGAPVPLTTLAGAIDADALPPLAAAGFITLHGGTLTVTRKGRYVANEVCVRLFRA